MMELINKAVRMGGKLYPNISGGKDGQAMSKALVGHGYKLEGFIHCDLGRIEWPESMKMCRRQAAEFSAPLHVLRRKDGRGMIEHWKHRMEQLRGQGKPFWSSSAARYCTSDMKRDPADVFYRNAGHDLIISCEGIRAEESATRAKKNPLHVRTRCSHSMYKGMTAKQAIESFVPGKRLALTWYPIFRFTQADVWATYGNTAGDLEAARVIYKATATVPEFWNFHPAYVYGNQRVSCMFCVLGCQGDLNNAATHAPDVLAELIGMEQESGFTFKNNFSLQTLLS